MKRYLQAYKGLWTLVERGRPCQADVLLYCHDFTRNYRYEGLAYSSLIDSINELLDARGVSTCTVARPYSELPPRECFGSVFTINGKNARARLLDALARRIPKLRRAKTRNPLQIRLWRWVIKKTMPKVVIGVEPCRELCIAAREADIPVFDVQHGIIAVEPTAHFYRFTLRDPDQDGWPDYIICRDETSFDWLVRHRSKYVTPLLLGHPWLSRFYAEGVLADRLVSAAMDGLANPDGRPVVLYSLQHLRNTSGFPEGYAEIPPALEAIMKSPHGSAYRWWIRLHPILLFEPNFSKVLRSLEEKFGDFDNIQWEEPTAAPLPAVLYHVRLHFTRDSSLAFEAHAFGIRTVFLESLENHPRLREMFDDLVTNGAATMANRDCGEVMIAELEELHGVSGAESGRRVSLQSESARFQSLADEVAGLVRRHEGSAAFRTRVVELFGPGAHSRG